MRPNWTTTGRGKQSLWLALLAALCTLALFAGLLASAPAAHAYDSQELYFLTLINNYRQQNGLQRLTLDSRLSTAANWHSTDMANMNYFSHTGSDGSSPFDRMRWAGYTYNTYLGENIVAGYVSNQNNGEFVAQQAFDAWKASPEHNANMLDPHYNAIGISRHYNGASTYHWYWTTDFGGVSEDNTPPTVSVPSPTGDTKVSGTVNVTANAADNVAVMQVDLYVDGQLVASPSAAPYSYTWNTTGLVNGSTHTLYAVARDTAGLTTQSGTTTVTVDNFTPAKRYYFTWYDQQTPGLSDWVLMANPAVGAGSARVSALVGANTYADRDIAVGAPAQTPAFPGVMGGPVTVQTTQPLIASQRSIYQNSFNETPAVADTALASTYYFTWYDSNSSHGIGGDWILIGNMGSSTANVTVSINGAGPNGTNATYNYSIAPGDRITPNYPGIMGGPVQVQCTNRQLLIVSQRVIYLNSFSETLGIPAGSLASTYYFPWYDNTVQDGMKGSWILIGNQDTGDATVDVFIGNQKMHDPANPANDFFTVPQGGRVTPIFPGKIGGPVVVTSTNGKHLIVSERTLYQDSFKEMQGLTASDAGTDLWFTWYDSKVANGMGGNWIMIMNRGASDASVDVYIGNSPTPTQQNIAVPAGGQLPVSYSETMGGPVRIVSTNRQPLIVTQRVIYKSSFSEIGGMKFP